MKKGLLELPKPKPDTDAAWFAAKVAELKAELERLPEDRQAQLERELRQGKV